MKATGFVRKYGTPLALALVVLAAAVLVWACREPDWHGRTFRMGYEQAAPHQIVGPDGGPGGPAFEVLREAARRRRIRLEWVRTGKSSEDSLVSGAVDLWPVFNDLPGRNRSLYISRGWMTVRYWLVVNQRNSLTAAAQVSGRTLALLSPGTSESIARLFLPGALISRQPNLSAVYEAVCRGGQSRGDMGHAGAARRSQRAGARRHHLRYLLSLVPPIQQRCAADRPFAGCRAAEIAIGRGRPGARVYRRRGLLAEPAHPRGAPVLPADHADDTREHQDGHAQ